MKFTKKKRLLGLLAAMVMCFNIASFALSEENIEEPPAPPAPVEDEVKPTVVVTAAPVTAAPVTPAPATEAPPDETEAPATETPDPTKDVDPTGTPDATVDPTQNPDPTDNPDSTDDPDPTDDPEATKEPEGEEEEPGGEEEKPFFGSVTAVLNGTPGSFKYGQIVTLEAILEGFEGFDYRICWEYSEDGIEDWLPAPGNNDGTLYQFVLDKENANWYWRVVVEAW